MNVFGIIAEFNPFHNGHQYLFDTIRASHHADYLVVVMSGNYVQRGEPAIIDKFARTQMALLAGADLVLELPLPYAISSAEMFALGGIMALDSLNCVTHVAFGCETDVPEAEAFFSIADYLLNEPPEFSAEIKRLLNLGFSYPAARKSALEASGRFSADEGKLLDSPNNILGIEYAKGILLTDSPLLAVPVSRSGSGHHETATAIRELLTAARPDFACLAKWVPKHCVSILQGEFEKHAPVTADDYSAYLYYALSSRPMSYYADKDIISADEAARISRMLSGYAGYTSFCKLVKSKQYTYTRLSRAMLRILFGLPELRLDSKCQPDSQSQPDSQNQPDSQSQPDSQTRLDSRKSLPSIPYLRLLGMKKEASHLLRKASVPILSKPAHAKNKDFGCGAAGLFQTELFANSLYYQIPAMKYQAQPLHEMECSPIILSLFG